jgi:hypothetical protein
MREWLIKSIMGQKTHKHERNVKLRQNKTSTPIKESKQGNKKVIIIIIMNIIKVLRPVRLKLKVFLSLHLRFGLPASRRPRGWYRKASLGRRLLSIRSRWPNHFFWYSFISSTMFVHEKKIKKCKRTNRSTCKYSNWKKQAGQHKYKKDYGRPNTSTNSYTYE